MRSLTPCSAIGVVASLLLGSASASADDEVESTTASTLAPIQVTAPRLERAWLESPSAVGVLTPEDIQPGRQNLQMDEHLNRVPGMQMQNRYNFSQDLRVSIRGFGARAPFGIRGLRVIVDGIPETLPDGQSQVDAIDLESLHETEVIRGPSSTLYGNAAGGVLDLRTQGGRDIDGTELKLDYGSHDYRRIGLKTGGAQGPWEYSVSTWDMRYNGYRDHSRAERRLFNSKLAYEWDDGGRLETIVRLLDAPDTQDPGSLTREQVNEDRRQARPESKALNGGQSAEQQTVGLVYSRPMAQQDDLTLRAFYTRRDFQNQLPFETGGQVRYERDFYGLGGQYTHLNEFMGLPARIGVGFDAEEQRDDRQRFNNLDGGVRGDQTFDQQEKARTLALFNQGDLALTDRLDFVLGARFDQLRIAADDRFQAAGEDRSGRETFNEWSYSTGLSYRWARSHQIYANIGTSFESPTFTEFANPDGGTGFNPDLKPEKAVNYEIGAKGFISDHSRYELALYTIRVRDEIVNFQQEAGRDFFENSGRSRRNGLELGLEHQPIDQLTLTAAYTYTDFEFRDFEDRFGNDFSGNTFPGVPRQQLFAEAAWRDAEGRFAALDMVAVDRQYADNANEVRVSGYGVANLRAGTRLRLQGLEVSPYLAVNNLFDKEYFSNVRINTFGGRFYEPAPERSFYAGVTIRPR